MINIILVYYKIILAIIIIDFYNLLFFLIYDIQLKTPENIPHHLQLLKDYKQKFYRKQASN